MKIKAYLLALAAVLVMTGCNSQNDSAEITTIAPETTTVTTTTPETTTVTTTTPETTTVTTTTPETTTVTTTTPETTTVTTTTPETTTVTTTTPETTTVTTTTPETTTVTTTIPETTAITTTTSETTTAATTTTPKITTVTTTTAAETEPDVPSVEIDGKTCYLTFEDNFDGAELDPTKWERCPEYKRQDLNNYWDNDMSYLDGKGNLVIEMSYDDYEDKYLSGAVRTKGLFEQTYGYFEINCKINEAPGYWTAFWMMTPDVVKEGDGGTDGTEIDIMESAYYPSGQIQNTLHWDGYGSAHRSEGNVTRADVYDGKFHTFSLLWTDEEYVFFIDGKESWRTDAKEAEGTCKVPLYMKITSEMGSWTSSQYLEPDNLPDYMLVDYVKVYKLGS